jgi:cysteine desulfurase
MKKNNLEGAKDDQEKNKQKEKIIYFDNNATTIMPKNVLQEIIQWTNMGNPSSDYDAALRCRNLINSFRTYIAKTSKFTLAQGDEKDSAIGPSHYRVIITSCASESNALIIRSVVDSYHKNIGTIPHIISTTIEHKSVIETLNQLLSENRITLSLVEPDPLGFITPKAIAIAFEENPKSALCLVMYANNETGVINDIKTIAEISHKYSTPFFTDAVQIYGKHGVRPISDNIDSFSVSFHKLYGPIGVGMLIIKEQFIRGYKLCGQIGGTQNNGFRGGTINTPGIAGSFKGLEYTMERRDEKNDNLLNLKRYIIKELSKNVPCKMYREFLKSESVVGLRKPAIEIVFISTSEETYLPNTLLFSVVKRTGPDMCNVKLKKYLCSHNIIVSIGSACNTDSDKASHVLKSMKAPPIIQKGTIRVSLNDEATIDDCNCLIKQLLDYLSTLQ